MRKALMVQIFKPKLQASPIHPTWITLSGPDAKDFLHRLTTVNLKTLGLGRGAQGCFLNPQGKIRSIFTLWNMGPDQYAFEMDAGRENAWKTSLLAAIDQFTFAEKMTLTDHTSQKDCYLLFLDSEDAAKLETQLGIQAKQTQTFENEIQICFQNPSAFGRTWLTLWGPTQPLDSWITKTFAQVKEVSFEETEHWRILSLTPKVDSEISETSNPLELGLREAIAENKGCYPGQEVIEKIIAYGAPPKRLIQIQGTGQAPVVGSALSSLTEATGDIGKITSVASLDKDHFIALGMIRKTHAKEGLEVQFSIDVEKKNQGTIIKVSPY